MPKNSNAVMTRIIKLFVIGSRCTKSATTVPSTQASTIFPAFIFLMISIRNFHIAIACTISTASSATRVPIAAPELPILQVDCKINHRSNDFRNQYDILPALRNQNLNTGDIREADQKYRRHDELHRDNGWYIVRTGQHQNCFPCIDDKVNHQWQCHHHNKLHGFRCHLAELIVTFLLNII